ncbi:MAG: hypothetical protein JW806_03490 [Sedimentisphaerales bacterium]|nr:hypothetical protein [Sedimentisphaerales bacterium]
MKKNLMLSLLAVAAIAICSNLAKAVEIEVESLAISNAEVKDCNEASGGKVVAFEDPKAQAKGEIDLEPGKYTVYFIMSAPDEYHDAVYITVGKMKGRLYPEEYSKMTKSKSFLVTILTKGTCPILIQCAETGVILDKLIIESEAEKKAKSEQKKAEEKPKDGEDKPKDSEEKPKDAE